MQGISVADVVTGLLSVIVLLLGAWGKGLSDRVSDMESFKDKVQDHWEKDAKSYLSKHEFSEFAKELKDSLIRIENKIETLRD